MTSIVFDYAAINERLMRMDAKPKQLEPERVKWVAAVDPAARDVDRFGAVPPGCKCVSCTIMRDTARRNESRAWPSFNITTPKRAPAPVVAVVDEGKPSPYPYDRIALKTWPGYLNADANVPIYTAIPGQVLDLPQVSHLMVGDKEYFAIGRVTVPSC